MRDLTSGVEAAEGLAGMDGVVHIANHPAPDLVFALTLTQDARAFGTFVRASGPRIHFEEGHDSMAAPENTDDLIAPRRFEVSRYNRRMAQRIARRGKLHEDAVAVAFTFNNLLTMCVFGLIQDVARFVPLVGSYVELGISLLSFYFHRIVIVTEENVYVYRDLPFHFPAKRLAAYERGPGVVRLGSPNPTSWFSRFIRRGQLTFEDGLTAYHAFIWIRRAQYVEQESNAPAGQ